MAAGALGPEFIEVVAVCPDCGSKRFWMLTGTRFGTVYRRCRRCGRKAVGKRVTTAEVKCVVMKGAADVDREARSGK
jgi:DNA-directed RNA polymerase subunit RPC12/RpoP